MAQQIKKKFIRNDAVDGTKIKLLSGQSLRIEGPSGEVELLKLGSQGEVLSKGQEIAFKSQVDELRSDLGIEESARISADQSLQSQIDNIISNVDPVALDSLTEIVQAFQSADGDLYETISALGTGATSAIAQETSRAQAAEVALQVEIDQLELNLQQEILDRQQEESRAVAAEAVLQSEIDSEESRATDAESFLQSEISSEVSRAQTAEASLQDQIYSEESTRIAADLEIMGAVDSETQRATNAETLLNTKIETEKGRIDAILSATNADYDSFAEIVQLINSVDTENDSAFASYVVSNNASVAELDERLDTVEPKVSTLETEMDAVEASISAETSRATTAESNLSSSISTETSRAMAAESALSGRISPIEESRKYEKYSVFEDNLQVRADGAAPKEDSSFRDGWYFKNETAGQKINWYFFDGMAKPGISLQDFSAHAVMTFDNVESPIMAVYTKPTGANDIMPGFAHSKVVYSSMSEQPQVGTKYLVYFGQNPTIHSELPRIQLGVSSSSSAGERSPTEQVLTSSFGSSSASLVSEVQFMVESLGATSTSLKFEVDLRIKKSSFQRLSNEITRALAAESSISTSLQSEISRATSFENSLQDQIIEEILRSTSADSELKESVESLNSQYSLLQSEVSVLQSETSSSIVFLQSQVDTVRSDIYEEISNRASGIINAEQSLEQKIKEVGISFKRETQLVTQQMITDGFFMLQNKAFDNSTTISIGRLFLIEDEDYQVVLDGGVSKVVFMGSIVPNQDESLEVDDLIKVKYFKDTRN